jgi:predicted dienelactone hydrolase
VWYPAEISASASHPYLPDSSGAPYPLIVYSHGYGGTPDMQSYTYTDYLVSHGFVVAGANHLDESNVGWKTLVDRPLDILFVINQLAGLKEGPITGIVDTDRVGVTGFSAGGYGTVAVSGARIDLGYLTNWCAEQGGTAPPGYCDDLADSVGLRSYGTELGVAAEGETWPAMTDERIRAVLPIAPCFTRLFGDKGLAEVSIPVLIVAGTGDENCVYEVDSVFLFDSLGAADRYLVSMAGLGHMGLADQRDLLRHYALAFFERYLRDDTSYDQYLTPESAAAFPSASFHYAAGSG